MDVVLLNSQRHLFDLPEDQHYLNCAYMSPMMKHVRDTGIEMLDKKARPFEIGVDDFFLPLEHLKRQFSALLQIESFHRIAAVPSVSYGIANVVHNINMQAGQNIVIVAEQFPSNVYPWQKLCNASGGELKIVPRPAHPNSWSEDVIRAIDDNTAAVSMGHVHWADGHRFDVEAIAQKARHHSALVIIDGTQSVGALPFNIEKVQPDALICAGYKWLMGPYSIGLAYYGPYFDDKDPIEDNWINRLHSDDFKGLVNYQPHYRKEAGRFNVGECSNFTHVAMLSAAIDQILQWSIESIQSYCAQLIKPYQAKWESLGLLHTATDLASPHLFGIRLPQGADLEAVKSSFATHSVYVSLRGDAIRVSPHVYNTSEDLEALTAALEAAL